MTNDQPKTVANVSYLNKSYSGFFMDRFYGVRDSSTEN